MIRAGKVTFLVRFGRWVCACLPKSRMDEDALARIRPLLLGGLACWCDKSGPEKF